MQKLLEWFDALGAFGVPLVLVLFVSVLFVGFFYFGKGIQTLVYRVQLSFGWVWFVLNWTFPPILAAIGYMMPALHEPAVLPIPDVAKGAFITIGIIGVAWLVFVQMLTANSPNTILRELITDFIVSTAWLLVFYGWALHSYGSGLLPLWLAIIATFCVFDVVVNTVIALRNAFQKNPMQSQRGER